MFDQGQDLKKKKTRQDKIKSQERNRKHGI